MSHDVYETALGFLDEEVVRKARHFGDTSDFQETTLCVWEYSSLIEERFVVRVGGDQLLNDEGVGEWHQAGESQLVQLVQTLRQGFLGRCSQHGQELGGVATS